MRAGGTLTNGRKECPNCGRKGLGFAPHPHASGWKDYNAARCRYCGVRYRVKDPFSNEIHTEGDV